MIRHAAHAGFFYPQDKEECLAMFHSFEERIKNEENIAPNASIGIAPHAGWVYSGYIAYRVFHSLQKSLVVPKTFVIFGAVHVPGVSEICMWPNGEWETVFGNVEIDAELHSKLVSLGIKVEAKHHLREHSIEVLLPFLKHFFPHAKVIPIMVPVHHSALSLGQKVGKLVDENTFIICSTDLTHYGTRFHYAPKGTGKDALKWVKNENDKRIIDLMLKLEDNKIIQEVQKNQNACGGGAIAATLAFAKTKQKKQGQLLDYTTSWDVYPQKEIDNFVGYSGILI